MRTLRNCTDFYGDRRTLNVELVVALRALSVALASETHTTHAKNTEEKKRPKRSTKRTVTPVNPGVAMRLVMRLELQIGEIPLRFSGISLFGFRSKGKLSAGSGRSARPCVKIFPFFAHRV